MPKFVNVTALAAHLGCSRVTINDYVARKVIERLPSGGFEQDSCRLKVFAYLRDKAGGRTGLGDKNLSEARAELAREQTAAAALKNAVARKEYVPLAIVVQQVEMLFVAFRERVLSMPGKIAATCEMRPRIEVEEVVRLECYEALEELSRPILPTEPPKSHTTNQKAE